jgi:hypothetical protein
MICRPSHLISSRSYAAGIGFGPSVSQLVERYTRHRRVPTVGVLGQHAWLQYRAVFHCDPLSCSAASLANPVLRTQNILTPTI